MQFIAQFYSFAVLQVNIERTEFANHLRKKFIWAKRLHQKMFLLEVFFVFFAFSQLIFASPISDCGVGDYSLYLDQYHYKYGDNRTEYEL